MMPENQKILEQPERDRGDGKQIDRRDAVGDTAIMKTMGWQQVRSFLASVVRKKLTPLISKMFDGGGRPPFGSNPRAGVFRIMLLLNESRLRLG